MRLWSIHPKYLDAKGLVALWREALLGQNVLAGKTQGYKNHPQLDRFKSAESPLGAIACYLRLVAEDADRRGYTFNKDKINSRQFYQKIKVSQGQVEYEFQHLLRKIKERDSEKYSLLLQVTEIEEHPLFKLVEGGIEGWEIVKNI